MRKPRFWFFPLILLCMFALFPETSWPQLILGQYEDEAPFRTWNTLGITTAASLALGETQFTSASDCAVSLSNPAQLTRLPKITFTVNSSFNSASFFKYSLVNTGVLFTDKNSSLSLWAFDFAGASLRLKNWAFALSMALVEIYDRPRADYRYSPGDSLYYSLNLNQEGSLKNINFSIARKFFKGFSAGIGLNFSYGLLKKDVSEKWIRENITITDNKSHEFQGFYLNGGLVWELAEKIEVAAIFRTPYVKKSKSESLLRYYAPEGNTDIKIEVPSNNEYNSEYKQPFVAGMGVSYKFSPELRVASDFTFYNWSKYKVIYFKEDELSEEEQEELYGLERKFKNIIKIGAGVEYMSSRRIFGQKVNVPLRAGLSYDPQPMKDPNSSYFYFSLGTGLHWGKFLLDAGVLVGKESGSGNSLSARKVSLSLSFRL